MRKNHHVSKSNRFPSTSKWRSNNPYPATPTQSTRPGLIDERLIKGSQQPAYDSMPPACDDEEEEFDAFGKCTHLRVHVR